MAVPDVLKVDMNTAAWRLLLAAGTHFRCRACFYTLPLKYRSPDDKYCIDCYQVVYEDKDKDAGDYILLPAGSGIPQELISQARDIDEKPVTIIEPVNPANKELISVRQRGRPRKDLSINRIIDSSKTCDSLAKEMGVSAMTISRRRRAAQLMLPAFSEPGLGSYPDKGDNQNAVS